MGEARFVEREDILAACAGAGGVDVRGAFSSFEMANVDAYVQDRKSQEEVGWLLSMTGKYRAAAGPSFHMNTCQ